ncbi:hypothetical protein [Nocardia africana]
MNQLVRIPIAPNVPGTDWTGINVQPNAELKWATYEDGELATYWFYPDSTDDGWADTYLVQIDGLPPNPPSPDPYAPGRVIWNGEGQPVPYVNAEVVLWLIRLRTGRYYVEGSTEATFPLNGSITAE